MPRTVEHSTETCSVFSPVSSCINLSLSGGSVPHTVEHPTETCSVFSPGTSCINHHPPSHLISTYVSFLLSCILLTFIFPSPVLKHRDFIDIELY